MKLNGNTLKVNYSKVSTPLGETSHSPYLAELVSERSNSVSSTGSQFFGFNAYYNPQGSSQSSVSQPLFSKPGLVTSKLSQMHSYSDYLSPHSQQEPIYNPGAFSANMNNPLRLSPDVLSMESRYAHTIPPLPQTSVRRIEQSRLRDMRKKLENGCGYKEMERIFSECVEDAVELATGSCFSNLLIVLTLFTIRLHGQRCFAKGH
jgi:hypothetical protein